MPRESKDAMLARYHAEALEEFGQIQAVMRPERMLCLEDRRFYSIAGAQWEGQLSEQYANRPRFEVNKIWNGVKRIISEYRNNRITVAFLSKDGKKDDKMADVCAGLFRADEQDSSADEAYDNAFEEAVGGGIGAIRLRVCDDEDAEGEDDDIKRIRIEPIYDADSTVYFDLNCKRQDKRDARTCYVLTPMTRSAYVAEYDDDPSDWPNGVRQCEFDWATPDVVYVAEHYRVEDIKETIHVFRGLLGETDEVEHDDDELDDDDGALRKRLEATGYNEVRRYKVKRKQVRKLIMSGNAVLASQAIVGPNIPIIPIYGMRWFVDNIERCMGHVRMAKDPQRLKNMQLSKLAEISASSSVEKPILLPEQVLGHESMWSEDNIANWPYLLVNPITNVDGTQTLSGPIAYTKSAQLPPALAALLQITEMDIKDILGNQQSGDQLMANTSAKAVELVQSRVDGLSAIYMSNMAKAMKRLGEVWLGIARSLYDQDERVLKTIDAQGEVGSVTVNQPSIDDEGRAIVANDIKRARFDVVVTVGPSSESKRAATVRSLREMMAVVTDEETRSVLTAMAMANMEGEGIGDVRDFFRAKLLRMGAVKPTEEEAKTLAAEAAAAESDPNADFLKAAAEEATAKAAKARADTMATVADAEKTRAETEQTQVETMQMLAGVRT
jgi:hypothetical protein